MSMTPPDHLLGREFVRLNATPASKEEAIAQACQLLVAAGCVAPAFGESMLRREAVANTFLGHGVAIPHGLGEDKGLIQRDGIAVLQVPAGVEWNAGQRAHLVVAIAAQGDAHITILRRLTRLIQDDARLQALFSTADADAILHALASDGPRQEAPSAKDFSQAFEWVVDYPAGLHARPASAWVDVVRAHGVPIRVRHGQEMADARNLVSLLQLGLRRGDTVTVSAEGEGAEAALAALRAKITGLTAQEVADAAAAAAKQAAAPVRGWTPPGNPLTISAIAASPGLAIGRLHVLRGDALEIPDQPVALAQGGQLLHEALTNTRQQLVALADATARRLGAQDAQIFKAQAELLNDSDLITLSCQLMVEGHGPAFAWNEAVNRMAARLGALGNPVLAARAADLRDVGRRVLSWLDPSIASGSLTELPEAPCILVAQDLSPSDTAGLDINRVLGLAMIQGGPTAHSAILARTLGLPAIVAGGEALAQEALSGQLAIVDGQTGRLYLNPSPEDVASAENWAAGLRATREREEAERARPATTTDGVPIEVAANVNRPDQVPMALAEGAEGVGLMRTEFLFLESGATPSEDEQLAIYRGMIEALEDRPLIIRALDIGGDKQVAHLHLPREENPFLGVRGARLLLRRQDLLLPQLRAIYRAAGQGGNVSIMFPMVTSVAEIIRLREICEEVRAAVNGPALPIGIMIEVPAAAIQADSLAAHCDFFSIGTNDLTQYTLAIDRQNPELAAEADSLHPAVLRLIAQTVQGARAHGRWVGVCGGIAGDALGAALLAGLGVSELSMTPRDIPAVKAKLRGVAFSALKALAEQALEAASAAEVRALELP
ncbi:MULTISPECIES: phosphoenolpyruvate--protein phosphotransferase [unclassified Acidocella]|uniref:phosphoenolpyruvate--protein phosphotransferase n=1 Tax=unclassified Acidocella TaxID=2648610 RepID=UPI00028E39F5|nr:MULTISPECIES: phosphoenolpyruvate--protein phosphotransferase [unclassified Acidocella]EKN00720.1 phosphoenolpyruvate-protein phosphotransferase [Acidocella sp. MX-AZ02]WBO60239.1 phosphoenolpyruvate--protein phosphotransferase [Acidocella sp. MX-AZ03]